MFQELMAEDVVREEVVLAQDLDQDLDLDEL
jgi:hypothetical protein